MQEEDKLFAPRNPKLEQVRVQAEPALGLALDLTRSLLCQLCQLCHFCHLTQCRHWAKQAELSSLRLAFMQQLPYSATATSQVLFPWTCMGMDTSFITILKLQTQGDTNDSRACLHVAREHQAHQRGGCLGMQGCTRTTKKPVPGQALACVRTARNTACCLTQLWQCIRRFCMSSECTRSCSCHTFRATIGDSFMVLSWPSPNIRRSRFYMSTFLSRESRLLRP